jgi:hypothetical protein
MAGPDHNAPGEAGPPKNAEGGPNFAGTYRGDPNTRLVALNAERAAEEAKGQVRWLRPEYQNAGQGTRAKGKQAKIDVGEEEAPAAVAPAPAPT